MTEMTTTWAQRQDASEETWDRLSEDDGRGYVSKYAGCSGFNWQAIRGEARLSASAPTRVEAMAAADDALAMPIEQFNAAVVAEWVKGIQKLEQQILTLSPGTSLLPGYQAGYAAGLDEALRRVTEALAPEAK